MAEGPTRGDLISLPNNASRITVAAAWHSSKLEVLDLDLACVMFSDDGKLVDNGKPLKMKQICRYFYFKYYQMFISCQKSSEGPNFFRKGKEDPFLPPFSPSFRLQSISTT